jgi:DNA polymerase-3 subunit alpha
MLTHTSIAAVHGAADGETVTVEGSIRSVVTSQTLAGHRWASLTLTNDTDAVEVLVFPPVYKTAGNYVRDNTAVTVTGRVHRGTDPCRLVATVLER